MTWELVRARWCQSLELAGLRTADGGVNNGGIIEMIGLKDTENHRNKRKKRDVRTGRTRSGYSQVSCRVISFHVAQLPADVSSVGMYRPIHNSRHEMYLGAEPGRTCLTTYFNSAKETNTFSSLI